MNIEELLRTIQSMIIKNFNALKNKVKHKKMQCKYKKKTFIIFVLFSPINYFDNNVFFKLHKTS